MPKKFDTNPLDPEFPAKAKAAAAQAETTTLPRNGFQTSEFPPADETEEQTRRFDQANFDYYSAPYQGQNIPVNYQTTPLVEMNTASDRKVAKIGLPEKFLIGLPYLPFQIGLVAGLIQLLVVPKSEQKVRFHAAQGLAANVAILIVSAILGVVGNVTDLADLGNGIFNVVTTIMMIVFAIKAWKGKPVHIEAVDDLTTWLEEKIQIKS
jgi:uncharacterized membrane protein